LLPSDESLDYPGYCSYFVSLTGDCRFHYSTFGRQSWGAVHFLILLANGISGRRRARNTVFLLFCAFWLAIWSEK